MDMALKLEGCQNQETKRQFIKKTFIFAMVYLVQALKDHFQVNVLNTVLRKNFSMPKGNGTKTILQSIPQCLAVRKMERTIPQNKPNILISYSKLIKKSSLQKEFGSTIKK